MVFLKFIAGLLAYLFGGAMPGDYHLGGFAKRASKPLAVIFFLVVGFTLIFLLYVALTKDT